MVTAKCVSVFLKYTNIKPVPQATHLVVNLILINVDWMVSSKLHLIPYRHG